LATCVHGLLINKRGGMERNLNEIMAGGRQRMRAVEREESRM